MKKILFIFLNVIVLVSGIQAQDFLKGRVFDADSDSIIAGVNIFNQAGKTSTRTAADGSYSIAANDGDRIIFSVAGFIPDTIIARSDLFLAPYDPGLKRLVISLEVVKVTTNYQADSLARRNYYSNIYQKQAGITGRNRPADGIGVVLSPLSFFSKESKQKRALRKRLEKQERDFFIDQSFSLPLVKKLTGLAGDSLSLFMYRYRPSYAFCRKTDRQGMISYINNKLKEFKNPLSKD